jgi:hypothetical protein
MKYIFVGSSSHCEAEKYAIAVFEYISHIDTSRITAVYWREAFPIGLLTFQALERMLRSRNCRQTRYIGRKPMGMTLL